MTQRCAITTRRVQCSRQTDGEHVTCDRHRDREAALLEQYHAHSEADMAAQERGLARAQALDELVAKRTEELAAEHKANRERRLAEHVARVRAAEDAIADAAVQIEES